MILGQDIVEHTQTAPFFRFKEPMTPSFSVFFKTEQELLFVAPAGNVPDASRYVVSVRSRHK